MRPVLQVAVVRSAAFSLASRRCVQDFLGRRAVQDKAVRQARQVAAVAGRGVVFSRAAHRGLRVLRVRLFRGPNFPRAARCFQWVLLARLWHSRVL